MKTKKLETIVLISAGLIIIAALVFLFALDSLPNSSLWVNILLASGFLLYIVYNVLTSSNYNNQVDELSQKLETEKAEKVVAQHKVEALTQELNSAQKELTKTTSALKEVQAERENLATELNTLKAIKKASVGVENKKTNTPSTDGKSAE